VSAPEPLTGCTSGPAALALTASRVNTMDIASRADRIFLIFFIVVLLSEHKNIFETGDTVLESES
jgi:hypothetical protein